MLLQAGQQRLLRLRVVVAAERAQRPLGAVGKSLKEGPVLL